MTSADTGTKNPCRHFRSSCPHSVQECGRGVRSFRCGFGRPASLVRVATQRFAATYGGEKADVGRDGMELSPCASARHDDCAHLLQIASFVMDYCLYSTREIRFALMRQGEAVTSVQKIWLIVEGSNERRSDTLVFSTDRPVKSRRSGVICVALWQFATAVAYARRPGIRGPFLTLDART